MWLLCRSTPILQRVCSRMAEVGPGNLHFPPKHPHRLLGDTASPFGVRFLMKDPWRGPHLSLGDSS